MLSSSLSSNTSSAKYTKTKNTVEPSEWSDSKHTSISWQNFVCRTLKTNSLETAGFSTWSAFTSEWKLSRKGQPRSLTKNYLNKLTPWHNLSKSLPLPLPTNTIYSASKLPSDWTILSQNFDKPWEKRNKTFLWQPLRDWLYNLSKKESSCSRPTSIPTRMCWSRERRKPPWLF